MNARLYCHKNDLKSWLGGWLQPLVNGWGLNPHITQALILPIGASPTRDSLFYSM